MEGHTVVISNMCIFIAHAPWLVFMVRVSCSDATKVSVLDAIPPCVMASLTAKQGDGFAFCLMPAYEEAVRGLAVSFFPQ